MKQIVEFKNGEAARLTHRKSSSGFTLVELLVVIGVITILIALLLPALSAARAQVQTIQCESNMRQVGAAVFAYVSENRGKLPAGSYADYTVSGTTADLDVFPAMAGLIYGGYLPQGPFVKNVYYTSNTTWNVYAPPVLQCPSVTDFYITRAGLSNYATTGPWQNIASALVYDSTGAEEFEPQPQHGVTGIYTHYVFNDLIYSRYNVYTINGYVYRAPFATLILGPAAPYTGSAPTTKVDPGQYSMSAVNHSAETWMAWESYRADIPAASAVFRHRKLSGNFLYFDGHVENLLTAEIQTTATYPGMLWDNRLIFNRP